jgi:predicted permease
MLTAFHRVIAQIRAMFQARDLDRTLDVEIESHIRLRADDYIGQGVLAAEAERLARIELGGLGELREAHRDARSLPLIETLVQDLRYAFRGMRRDTGFTVIAVLILALGIGANITVFSVVNTILLRPLPFRDAQQLVRIVQKNAGTGESDRTYTADATQDFQQQNRSFQSVSGYFAFTGPDNLKLIGPSHPVPVTGILVADKFFETLGVGPAVGRLFRPEEFVTHTGAATLLSYPFWQRQLGGNPNIVGKTINLNGKPVTIVGVLPDTFDFGSVFSPGARVDLFMPYIMDDFREDGNDLALIGRLKPGIPLALAQSEADHLFPNLYFEHKHPEYGKGYTAQLTGLKDYVSGQLRRSLIVLWCAVGLILLIVCVNLSNLLLARTTARSKEFAMRSALGARSGRLVRQLLTESLVLSGAGALLGLGLAYAVTLYLAQQGSIALPLLTSVRVDGTALAWTLFIGVGAAILFGLAPGFRMARVDLQEILKGSGGHGASQGKHHDRMRSALVITEVALSCVLLVGAGLLLRSFLRVLDVDLGFEASHAASITVDDESGMNTAKRAAAWQEVVRRAAAIPGVAAAGITDNLPMSRNRSWGIKAKGGDYEGGKIQTVFVYIVSPGYFKAMGMRLTAGHDINWADLFNNENVVVINETVARKLWPRQNPIGRIAQAGGQEARVVGVVADVRETSAEENAGWQMYLPATKQFGPDGAKLVLRSNLPTSTLAPTVMSMLRQINPEQPATQLKPIQNLVDHATSPRRFFVVLVGIFAGLGLLLASLGIYGVISYSVTRQTQEIGIRMAVGATQWQVLGDVIRETLRLAIIGIGVGTVASMGVARLIAFLLFGTTPTDPLTFAAMIIVLGTVALLAGYIPAHRASRIDPMLALRAN